MGDTVPETPDNYDRERRRRLEQLDEILAAAEQALRDAMNDLYAIDAEVVGRWLLGSIDSGRLSLRRQATR